VIPDKPTVYDDTDYNNLESGQEFYDARMYARWTSDFAAAVQRSCMALTTAPVADNADFTAYGLTRCVVLAAEPATRYNGYVYVIG